MKNVILRQILNHVGKTTCKQKYIKQVRKKRSDCKEPHKCNICDFTSKNTTNLKQHYLNFHGDLKERESEFKFYCKL